ncbi:MAG: hypothetical protein ABJC19_08950 [Gemmatimonadota bacterium]
MSALRMPHFVLVPLLLLAGPPSIKVTMVTNPAAAPTPGAVLAVEAHHHMDGEPLVVTGRMEGLVDGRRVSRLLVVTPTRERGHFGVTSQWEVGRPWVLVLATEMGEHGTAVALVTVNATGKVTGIEAPDALRSMGKPLAAGVVERSVASSLKRLGAK